MAKVLLDVLQEECRLASTTRASYPYEPRLPVYLVVQSTHEVGLYQSQPAMIGG